MGLQDVPGLRSKRKALGLKSAGRIQLSGLGNNSRYMGMSMKLSPNLERAIAFAAEHGEGKIAESFRELLWNSQTGVYSNLEEGLDEMAYNWGKYSPEFKQALMTIRSSVLEPDETHRNILLDSALEDSLTSIGNKLSDRATSLKGPSMNMFYLGVLLPLILIIVLPIGAVLGGNTFFSNLFVDLRSIRMFF